MEILFYILQTGSVYAALFLIYFLLFRNNTNFQTNRIYLLIILPLSFILPLLDFSIPQATQYQITLPTLELSNTLSETMTYSWKDLIFFICLIASATVLFKLIYNLINTINTIAEIKNGTQKEIQPFSFFSFIHVSDDIEDEDRQAIFHHEQIHSTQFHSIDILIYEISKVILWWNPILWMGLNSVKSNHEFIADKLASEKADKYSSVLVAQLLGVNCSVLANNFKSKPLIKKRIMMMKTKKSNRLSVLKYVLVIPVIGLTIMATTNKNVHATPIETVSQKGDNKVYDKVDVMPEFKGGQEALFKYLGNNIKYPKEAKTNNLQGKVFVSFIIDKKGNITDVKVIMSVHTLLDQESTRVIKSMPKWKPGKQNGKKVNVQYTLPINFALEG